MEKTVFYTEKAFEIITLAKKEALAGNEVMTYYYLGKLDTFLYLLGYPNELNKVFNEILTLLNFE